MSSVLRSVRKRKKGCTLGAVDVIDREGYAELEVDAKVEWIRSLVPLGLLHIEELLDEEVTALAGERYARKDPSVGGRRHGSNPGTVGLAGQRVPIRVPRIRPGTEREIPLRSYEALHGDRAVNDLLLRRVLYGISCRNSAAAAEAIPGAIELSGSTVSRAFIEASAAKLRALQERDLSREGVVLAAGDTQTADVQLDVAPFAQQVDVVGVAPLPGTGVSRNRVPAAVFVVRAAELEERQASSLADALHERLGAVTLDSATANLFQPTLRIRGFTASPLLGLPQGVAVYQNGVRINEPFGDTVQFDLIPQFALDEVQLSAGAEPTYGLNALGGALALRLKNGFATTGFRGALSGGSFDRVAATAEWGAHCGSWAVYLGATRFDETGWRVASPSEVTQAVADVAYRKGRIDAGVSVTYADSSLNGNAPPPIELLEVDRSAVFTYPDTTENQLAFVQGRYNVAVSPTWSVQGTGYYRDVDRHTLNGDEAAFAVCDDDSFPPGAPDNTLCFGAGDDDDGSLLDVMAAEAEEVGGDEVEEHPLVDVNTGRFITEDDAEGDAAFNRTTTRTKGYGAALQATAAAELDGRENVLTLGMSADLADIHFGSSSEVGTLTPERSVAGAGRLAGIFGEAPDDQFNTDINTDNLSVGLYFSDTLSLTDRVHLTTSGRFNHARIDIVDRLGTSLNGDHDFSRFNVGAGAVYEVNDAMSLFGRYAESNRAPTAAELNCADPAEPCRVPNAFVSDPPLEQAVARSVEAGLRGRLHAGGDRVDWSVTVYRTAIADDILFVASAELIGTGFFQNAGDTRRVGLEADLSGQIDRVGWFASYGLVQATFESPLELPSNPAVNDAANEEGMIHVAPGDRLPGIPRHSVKAGVSYAVTDTWDIALDTVAASSRIFVGDEGNDQVALDGYGVAHLRSVYRVHDNVELFVRVDNLFNNNYATFGVLAGLEVFLAEVPDAEDPRFVSPGAPRSGFAGLRIRF